MPDNKIFKAAALAAASTAALTFASPALADATPECKHGTGGANSTECGANSNARANGATAVGANADANGIASTAVGQDADATLNFTTALGDGTRATGAQSTALGARSNSTGLNSLALALPPTRPPPRPCP
jgi:hypothetical protein